MRQAMRLIGLTLPGVPDPSIAIAASRSGALGVLDLEYTRELAAALAALTKLARLGMGERGVKIDVSNEDFASALVDSLPPEIGTIVLARPRIAKFAQQIQAFQRNGRRVLVEATEAATAVAAAEAGAAGIILKGNEAGGRIGDETAFVLFQRCISQITVPLWIQGGIGPHAAAACIAGGAAGVVLDWQLALAKESPLLQEIKDRLGSMDGSETMTIGGGALGDTLRVYARPGLPVIDAILAEGRQLSAAEDQDDLHERWRSTVTTYASVNSPDALLLAGQDAAFGADLARRYRTVSGIIHAIDQATPDHIRTAQEIRPLDEHGPLAVSHGTRYPILQGPMTRVSDVASFCEAVGAGGALPFLALAMMRAPKAGALLQETKERMGDRPWGVGILGFVPLELRQEQLEEVRKYHPPFAIIAGGRPDQAARLEQEGITTYLHVPSPGLLELFLGSGSRRFIFEGRECGGHVGPRSSFVLWQPMIDLIAAQIDGGKVKGSDCHIVFAGGIHDPRSAAMVAVMASPLTARGVKIGVLMGTAYLFTREAVASGAITEGFQIEALQSDSTVLVETGPGHAIRCFNTPFVTTFEREKKRLLVAKRPHEEMRATLEELNLGRLRIASKGIKRHPRTAVDPNVPRYVEVPAEEQRSEGMYMSGQIAALRDAITTIADLHHDVAAGSTAFLHSINVAEVDEVMPAGPCDVAIIGMATLLPKASTLQQYWANIVNKVDAIEEVPPDRWDPADYFDSDRLKRDRVYSRWGGFLDPIPFDPVVYGMPPNSVRAIEPLQLLTLEVARAALAHAGYSDRPFDREHTSVILGAGGGAADVGQLYGFRSTLPMFFGEHADAIVEQLDKALPDWTEDSFAGILMNVAAGRVANRLDLGGANFTVDAACASSLAAVYLGVRELESGTSNMVLVGGVDTMQGPFAYVAFSKTQALSPHGRCRTFDESADGIAISEGLAMLVLKRREDAERDGDQIYAIIKGIGSSSDGRDKGLTAPRPEGQIRALERAYTRAGISPATVGLIEAHGTGTVAGDRAEVAALAKFFARYGAEQQNCAIGSVKSMIGHTKCTAGVASLAKVALALHEGILPATLGVEKPSSHINFPETPFYINSETRPWIRRPDGSPRRAGTSAFGFGGTNFHVVLEEYTDCFVPSHETALRDWPSELLIWAAADRSELLKAITPIEQALAAGARPPLADLAFTICSLSESKPKDSGVRLAIVAHSLEDLGKKLASARAALADASRTEIVDPTGVFYSDRPVARDGRLAFLFPGQGSQYLNMGRDLALHFSEARATYDQADTDLTGQYARPLTTRIFPPPAFADEETRENRKALTDTHVAQPALGAVAMATYRLLQALGITPAMTGGHSYGEFVALWAAGVFDDETLLRVSEARGRFMRDSAGQEAGTMAAVEADAATVKAILAELQNGAVCANINAPRQTVIAGAKEAVDQATEALATQGIRTRALPVACAFHSPLVATAREQLAAVLSEATTHSPGMPVYSNTTGTRHADDPGWIVAVLAEHLARPVEFMRQIEAMYEDGARVFVEVGPKGVLTGLVGQILAGRPHVAIATDQEGRSGLYQLQLALARLAAEGAGVATARLFAGRGLRRIDLHALDRSSTTPAYTPTTWLVNGTRAILARDADKPRPSLRVNLAHLVKSNGSARGGSIPAPEGETTAPMSHHDPMQAVSSPSANGHAPAAPAHDRVHRAQETAPPNNQVPVAAPTTAAPAPPVAAAPVSLVRSDATAVVAQFQQVMSHFLETQRAVMLAYLGGTAGAPSAPLAALPSAAAHPQAAVPTPARAPQLTTAPVLAPRAPSVAQPTPAALTPAPAAPAVTPVPAAPATTTTAAAVPALTREGVSNQLLAIVTDRTGYPPEMLGLDLDLEADLGIDSIKRVEILGTFRQQLGAYADQSEAAMEHLAGLKTLRGIIEWAVAHSASGPTATGMTPVARPAASPPPTSLATTLATAAPAPAAAMTAMVEPLALTREGVSNQLLAIVTDRTGYPPEMLGLDLDLEADLGIDSIKRVEILGTFRQQLGAYADQSEAAMEHLAGLKTLRGIIEWAVARAAGDSPSARAEVGASVSATNGASVAPRPADRAGIYRSTVRMLPTAPANQVAGLAPDGVILVTDDGRGIAATLAERLGHSGIPVALVKAGTATAEVEPAVYTCVFESAPDVQALAAMVRAQQGAVAGIIHLLPLRPALALNKLDLAKWRERLAEDAAGLFHLAQAAGSELHAAAERGGAAVLAVTGMGGAFGFEGSPSFFPGNGGVTGLAKTLALEWPDVRVRAIDLDADSGIETVVGHLLAELYAADTESEIGYFAGGRCVAHVEPAPVTVGDQEPVIAPSSVILLTGGARGITAEVALDLARRYQPTLLLAGRSPQPMPHEAPETASLQNAQELKAAIITRMRREGKHVLPVEVEQEYRRILHEREMRETLQAIEAAGAIVRYFSVDMRDERAVRGLLDDIYSEYGRLDGVVHGAGIIEDKLIERKDPASFRRVFETKTDSAFLLARLLRFDQLRFLVFFSSVSGRFGNRGQGDYAAANEVLNKLAGRLDRTHPGRVVAINWGPWATGGMVSTELERQFAARGVLLIPRDVGVRMFDDEVRWGRKGEVEVVVTGGTWLAPRDQEQREPARSVSQALPAGTTWAR